MFVRGRSTIRYVAETNDDLFSLIYQSFSCENNYFIVLKMYFMTVRLVQRQERVWGGGFDVVGRDSVLEDHVVGWWYAVLNFFVGY